MPLSKSVGDSAAPCVCFLKLNEKRSFGPVVKTHVLVSRSPLYRVIIQTDRRIRNQPTDNGARIAKGDDFILE